jgi:hypothetical protein
MAEEISKPFINPRLHQAQLNENAFMRTLRFAQPIALGEAPFITQPLPGPLPRPARPLTAVPVAPENNPLNALPFPVPGDRIKADDFKLLSQSLRVIHDAYQLSGALFGRSFGEVKQVLAAQQYVIATVMSVFGTELNQADDGALDERKVVQVMPVKLGERNVNIVLTEAVETRRFAPNLIGLSYAEANERLRASLGDITFPASSMPATQLVGMTLAQAKQQTPQ